MVEDCKGGQVAALVLCPLHHLSEVYEETIQHGSYLCLTFGSVGTSQCSYVRYIQRDTVDL